VALVATIGFGLLIIGVAANEDSRIARVLSSRWLMLAGAAGHALHMQSIGVRAAGLAGSGQSASSVWASGRSSSRRTLTR